MIEIDGGYLIMEMVEKKPAKIAPFEEVKEEVRLDLMEERKKELAGEDARALLSKAKENGALAEATAGMEKEVKTTEYFERSGSIPGIGYERQVLSTAFSLSSKKPLPEKILQGRKGYYVICFTEKKLPEESEFEKEKENIREQLLAQKQNRYFADWLSGAKNRKEITYNQDVINFDI
jgi:parvulin-like peptidyl-prolyl isomerase